MAPSTHLKTGSFCRRQSLVTASAASSSRWAAWSIQSISAE